MAQTWTLTGKETDLVGGTTLTTGNRTIRGYLELSEPSTTAVDTGERRSGTYPIAFLGDGTWTVAGIPATDTAGWYPEVQAMRVVVNYTDPGTKQKGGHTSNWFKLTGNLAFNQVVEAEQVAVQNAFDAATDALASAASAASAASTASSAATSAAYSATLAQLVADIADPEDTMTAVDFDNDSDFRTQQDARHALVAARARRGSGELLRHHMATGTTCNWVHIGDSTGDASDEWLRLAVLKWAADYPGQRVIVFTWVDGTQTYDAGVTVQAGTGSLPTLRVFNGSMPGGSFVGYFDSRVDAMVVAPLAAIEAPSLLTISSCHNDAGGSLLDYFTRMDAFVAGVRASFPNVGVAVSSQNPEFSPRDAPTIAGNLLRNRAIRDHTIEKGWGYIAGFEPFWNTTDNGLSLTMADGVHPTADGSKVWSEAGVDFLRGLDDEDTGWRLIGNGTFGVLTNFKIAVRRVGKVVQLITAQTGAGATGDGAAVVATLTAGFRPTDPAGMVTLPATGIIGSDTIPIAGASMFVDAAGTVTVNAKNTGRHYCTLTFSTSDPWPGNLPGTAA